MEIRPLIGALGAEIFDIDLSASLGENMVSAIRAALWEHQVLVFRDQKLTLEQHRAFAQNFGPLHVHPYIAAKPVDVADFREVQNTPKWTGSGTLAYSTPVGEGDLAFSTTLSYRSKTYQFEVPNPYIDQDGYALLDANLVYTAPGGRWSLGVHGRNLTDKEYKTSGYNFVLTDPTTGAVLPGPTGQPIPALGKEGTLTAYYGNPRQVFVTGTLHF